MLRCTNFGLDPGRPWTRPREETSPTLIFSHWPSQAAPPGEMCAGLLSAATRVLILLALSLSHMGSHPSEHMLGVSCGWTTIPAESWQEGALRLRGAGPHTPLRQNRRQTFSSLLGRDACDFSRPYIATPCLRVRCVQNGSLPVSLHGNAEVAVDQFQQSSTNSLQGAAEARKQEAAWGTL